MAISDALDEDLDRVGGSAGTDEPKPVPRPRRGILLISLAGAAIVVVAFTALRMLQAAHAGEAGKSALLGAEKALGVRDMKATDRDLGLAKADFARVRSNMNGLGPILPVLRFVPFVRIQVRAIEAVADAGTLVTQAGENVSTAVGRVLQPTNPHLSTSAALDDLRVVSGSLKASLGPLDTAIARIGSLNSVRLIGPLGGARKDLLTRLPAVRDRVVSAQQGVDALIAFAGGNGARRYLVLTQNPDEVRPTGGYIGTYGVLDIQEGHPMLETFAGIETWYLPRPQADIPADLAPTPFKLLDPPVPQTIADVNTTPDWPTSARLAMALWQKGGGEPVDGVISLVPAFFARVLGVLGPVEVPDYNETVSASSLVDRLNFYTHVEGAQQAATGDRKRFVGSVAQAVVQKLLEAPAASWVSLGSAVGRGFDAREALAWTPEPAIESTLARRGWDGALPVVAGDFLNDAEFEYGAKNGSALKRVFDHHVTLRADGSARVETDLTVTDTDPVETPVNMDSLSYITLYGPERATLVDGSDPPYAVEPTISGHPAAGWLSSAPPGGEATLTTVWDAPAIAFRQPDGSWLYRIRWMHLPGHLGDVLHLQVDAPAGWHWIGAAPPSSVSLDTDFSGSWQLRASSSN